MPVISSDLNIHGAQAVCPRIWTSAVVKTFFRTLSPRDPVRPSSTGGGASHVIPTALASRWIRRRRQTEFVGSDGRARIYSLVRQESQPLEWAPIAKEILLDPRVGRIEKASS